MYILQWKESKDLKYMYFKKHQFPNSRKKKIRENNTWSKKYIPDSLACCYSHFILMRFLPVQYQFIKLCYMFTDP